MGIDIVVPALGESITEATIAAWLKEPGDAVGVDEPLVELETDKANLEICAPKAGVLAEIRVAAGEDVEVGAVIGRIDELAGADPQKPTTEASAAEAATTEATPATTAAAAKPPPSMGRLEFPSGLVPAEIARSGADGKVTLEDLLAFVGLAPTDPTRSGPAARKLLADHGIDPGEIPATGRDGRITKEDVRNFLAGRASGPAGAAASRASAVAVEDPRVKRVRMTRMRRTIAARLKQAQNTAAILTTFNEVDMGAIRELRSRHRDEFKKMHGVKLGFTSFFVKACVAALKEIPTVNAEIDGNEIVYKNYYDIGIAVSTPNGLVVPVIRDCDAKSPAAIEKSLGELAAKAQDGSLAVNEMQRGTFSITNGGVFGSLLSTPILNPPESAILGLHKIEDRPIARNGEVVIRPMMYLALSYDHRIIDGREAVTFLVKVKEGLENPDQLAMNLEEP
ncbi:MAG: 2-oxoglutarate dehydrogenase complex dihydrolipoyllysine-residue succinyltransferase [Myxococcales bacterium]|nr:2-oxoglutarate dehydrogenase complex dihydrolipoyllysine-residue succinyltransferase [Myxococcales bacterium]